ncbi:MAG: tetratricopeptide repeat protein [Deltaproteobacteria bacterium]|nr:tetratricopeptide repeat protein [Deltaproteobacteria bacterium]
MSQDTFELEAQFRRDPRAGEPFNTLRRHYKAQGQLVELAKLYELRAAYLDDALQAAELCCQAADQYEKAKQRDAEIRALQKALRYFPDNSRPRNMLRRALEETGRQAELVLLLEDDVAYQRDDTQRARAAITAADVWRTRFNRLDRALALYLQAYALDQRATAAVERAREILLDLGQWEQAAQLSQRQLEHTHDVRQRVELLSQLAQIRLERLRDIEGAAACYEEAWQLRPTDEALCERLATVLASPEWPAPGGLARSAELFVQLAKRRATKNDADGAIAYLKRALGASPADAAAIEGLERLYSERNRFDDLDQLFAHRIALARSEQERIQLLLAQAAIHRGRIGAQDTMRRCYEQVVEIDPTNARALRHLHALYEKAGAHQERADLLKRTIGATESTGDRVALMLELARLLRDQLGCAEEGAAVLHDVLQLDPLHADAIEHYQQFFRRRGDYHSLCELLRFAADNTLLAGATGRAVDYLVQLAEVSERSLGDLNAAEAQWGEIAKHAPDDPRPEQAVSRLQSKLRMWQRAEQTLAEQLEQATDDEQRRKVLRNAAQTLHDRQGPPARIAALLRESIEVGDRRALQLLADSCERCGDYEGLVWALQQQLDHHQLSQAERVTNLRRLVIALNEQLERPHQALTALNEIIQVLPQDRRAFAEASQIAARLEDDAALVALYQHQVSAATGHAARASTLKRLANFYADDLGDYQNAIESFEQARELASQDPEIEQALDRLYQQHNDTDKLVALLEQRLKHGRQLGTSARVRVLRRIARLHEQRQDHSAAIAAYQGLLREMPAARDAYDALDRLFERDGDVVSRIQILEQRIKFVDTPAQRLALTRQLVELLGQRPKENASTIIALQRKIVEELAPADLEACRQLRELLLAAGQIDQATVLYERELLLCPAAEKPALALQIAELWDTELADRERARLSYERVVTLAPEATDATLRLAELYRQGGCYLQLFDILPNLLPALPQHQQRELIVDAAELSQEHWLDPPLAFEWYRQALECGDQQALDCLRRIAAEYGLFEELFAVFAQLRQQAAAGTEQIELTLEMAELADEKLGDAARAFSLINEAIAVDGSNDALLPQLTELADRSGHLPELCRTYDRLMTGTDPVRKERLLRQRIELATTRINDPALATTDLVGLAQLRPDQRHAILEQVEALAPTLGNWEPLIGLARQFLNQSENDEERLQLLELLVDRLEHRVGDPRRAFPLALQAFVIGQDAKTEQSAWRLATAIADLPPLIESRFRHRHDATEEIDVDSVEVASDSQPLIIASDGDRQRDPTMELTIAEHGQLLVRHPRKTDQTVELSKSDLIVLGTAGRPRPPIGPLPPLPSLSTSWESLANAYRALPAATADERIARLLRVARVWREGAEDVDRTFDVLAEAAAIDYRNNDLEDALIALAAAHQRYDRLVEIFRGLAERARDSETLCDLHRRCAELLLEHGPQDHAEAHLCAVVALDPDDEPSRDKLIDFYQQRERWQDIAQLHARRLEQQRGSLADQTRHQTLLALADIYQEKLDRPYDAADVLARLVEAFPQDQASLKRLAALYRDQAVWPKLTDCLKALADNAPDPDEEAARWVEVAEVYRDELELPDQAIEAFETAVLRQPHYEPALVALEDLYRSHSRPHDLLTALERHAEAIETTRADDQELSALLCDIAEVHRSLGQLDQAAASLDRARSLGSGTFQIDQRLSETLLELGRHGEAAVLLQDAITRAEGDKADPSEVAEMRVALARMQRLHLGDCDNAEATLCSTLDRLPAHVGTLRELLALHQTAHNYEKHAETAMRLAEAVDIDETPIVLAGAARVALSADRSDVAIGLLSALLEHSPDDLPTIELLIKLSQDQPEQQRQLLLRKHSLVADAENRSAVLTQLGRLEVEGGNTETAQQYFAAALEETTDFVPAIDALAEMLLAGDDVEQALVTLQQVVAKLGQSLRPDVAPIFHRLAHCYERQGNDEEAYRNLQQALRLAPTDLRIRLTLGRHCYRARRWREALRHLREASEHPDAEHHPSEAAEALYMAGICERRLRRPDRAAPFFRAAIALDQSNTEALAELAEAARQRGDTDEAADLLQRVADATSDPLRRATLYLQAAEILGEDAQGARAAACFDSTLMLLGDDALEPSTMREILALVAPQLETMVQTLANADRHRSAALAADLLIKQDAERSDRNELLLLAAGQYDAAGDFATADERREQLLEVDPYCSEAVEGIARSLEAAGRLDDLQSLLRKHLRRKFPEEVDERQRRCRVRLFDMLAAQQHKAHATSEAIQTIKRRLELEDDLPTRVRLAELCEAQGDVSDASLANHRALVDRALRTNSLRALITAATKAEQTYRAHHLLQSLKAVDALSKQEMDLLAASQPSALAVEQAYAGEIAETDRIELIALPAAVALGDIFECIWRHGKELLGLQPLSAYGVRPTDRISPVEQSNVAMVFSAICRALGVKQTTFYRSQAQKLPVLITRSGPPALVISPALEKASAARLRFLLGRAIEMTQPSHILADILPTEAFTRLLSAALYAYHPRYLKADNLPEKIAPAVEELRHELPYAASKELGEILREHATTQFDSAAWRAAVELTTNRVGLLLSGDLADALDLLDDASLSSNVSAKQAKDDLIAFNASDAFYRCRRMLGFEEAPAAENTTAAGGSGAVKKKRAKKKKKSPQ